MYSTNAKASKPVKKIVMIRICFTVIAYIISFLSHSNELDATREDLIFSEQRNSIQSVVELDSLREESCPDLHDLN